MRSFEKVLLVALCLVFTAGMVSAKILDGDLYEVPKTTIVPTIDGNMDAVWKTLDANFQNYYVNGTVVPDGFGDLLGWHKVMYDDNNLYILFYTADEAITTAATLDWERDAVEIYVDADNSKAAAFDGKNDIQMVFKYLYKDREWMKLVGPPAWFDTVGTKYKFKDDSTTMSGYWFEASIPLKSLKLEPVAGTKIGLEFQQDDNDDGKVRESISKWWLASGDDSWQVPGHWGTGILSDRMVTTELEILKTKTAPVIDGALDALYTNATQLTENVFVNGSIQPDDYSDNFFRTYLAYDDNNLYAFFQVWDESVTSAATLDWERDAVEIYVDADNSKAAAFDGKNDIQLTVKYLFKDREWWKLVGPAAWFDTTGAKYKIADVDSVMGYTVEMLLPLKSLKLEPVADTKIGLEAQIDDNDDGKVRESIGKWWLQSGDDSWQVPGHWGTAFLSANFITTGVEEAPAQIAKDFRMAQNYPNPFNPVTTIAYTLKSSGKVRLAVYDLMGKEVAVLVDGVQSAGIHQVPFSAEKLTSGIYFYKLQAGDKVYTNKMTLMK